MTAPAHHKIRRVVGSYHTGVAQNAEHRIAQTFAGAQIKAAIAVDLVFVVNDVPERGKQMLLNSADHLAVDIIRSRGVEYLQLQTTRFRYHTHFKVRVGLQNFRNIVALATRVQHSQRTGPKNLEDLLIGLHHPTYLAMR